MKIIKKMFTLKNKTKLIQILHILQYKEKNKITLSIIDRILHEQQYTEQDRIHLSPISYLKRYSIE